MSFPSIIGLTQNYFFFILWYTNFDKIYFFSRKTSDFAKYSLKKKRKWKFYDKHNIFPFKVKFRQHIVFPKTTIFAKYSLKKNVSESTIMKKNETLCIYPFKVKYHTVHRTLFDIDNELFVFIVFVIREHKIFNSTQNQCHKQILQHLHLILIKTNKK